MYYNGRGVPQSDSEALKWYRLAADQGFADAQYNIGIMYGNGEGVPQDNVQAWMWFDLAAEQGSEPAKKNRDVAASRMTSDQMAEAQRLAREWKPVAER
jgi:TPR repeat protein